MKILKKQNPFYLSANNGLLQILTGLVENTKLKVNAFALGKIPLDTFRDGEIVRSKLFAKMVLTLMKNSWPRPIKSNFCHFIVPDKFVFSKVLVIPKIKEKELDQTIRFKIKNFLPHKLEDIYLDWQLLDGNSNKIEAMAVAIEKRIIDSYFSALKLINIYPLSFQPESLALAYLVALSSLSPALVVFATETILSLVFVERGGVLFNTTINLPPLEKGEREIGDEINNAAKFWRETFAQSKKLTKVYFIGALNNKQLVLEALEKNFKLKPLKLMAPVLFPKKISEARLARLVPLFGLTFFSRLKGKKQKKITLIPCQVRKEREKFKFEKRLKSVFAITAFFLLSLISIYIFVFLTIFFQAYKAKLRLSGLEKIVFTAKQTRLEKKTLAINQKIDALNEVLDKEETISSLLLQINKLTPAGILIKEVSFDTSKKAIIIKGAANSREDILAFDNSFSLMGKVNIPLSNYQDNKNIIFKASIILTKIKK